MIEADHDFVMRVQPASHLTRTIGDATRSYLASLEFPDRLIDDVVTAVGEAVEQLIAVAESHGAKAPFEVGLAFRNEAVSVQILYEASLPLNPHQEADYEVPDGEGADDLAGLWLHLIKRVMDRVFFRIAGNRAALVMMKYHRAETERRKSWVMGLKPRLRPGITIERAADAAAGGILHDLEGDNVLKLSRSDLFLIERIDGARTLHEIYLDHAVEIGPTSPEHIKRIYETLEAAGMLAGDTARRSGRRSRWQRWLSPTLSIPRPDAAVTWMHDRVRFLFHPPAVALLLAVGFSGFIPLARGWSGIAPVLGSLPARLAAAPLLVVAIYFISLVCVALHELAHGVACKHFGGRVRQLGIMWYLAMFIFFCDTTAAWNFPKKSQRIWVSLAGPLVTWALWGLANWCLGAATGDAATILAALFLINTFALVMNFNPLLRMDAYYILMDWLDLPNLQTRAFAWLRWHLYERFLPGAKPRPTAMAREVRIFLVYGLLSAFMSLFFIVVPFLQLADLWVIGEGYSPWILMPLVVVTLLVLNILRKVGQVLDDMRRQEFKIS